jgi:hypothetical protein
VLTRLKLIYRSLPRNALAIHVAILTFDATVSLAGSFVYIQINHIPTKPLILLLFEALENVFRASLQGCQQLYLRDDVIMFTHGLGLVEAPSRYFRRGVKKNRGRLQLGQWVSAPRFELSTYRIKAYNVATIPTCSVNILYSVPLTASFNKQ